MAPGPGVINGKRAWTARAPLGPRRPGRLLPGLIMLLAAVTIGARQDPTFVSRSELVVLHVNVQDRNGGFVSDLPQRAFAVFEDLQPQLVSLFVNDDAPVTVGLLIDNSISMRRSRDLVVAAAREFAQAGHARDEFFALAFNEHVVPVLPPGTPFTSDPSVLHDALSSAISARGKTAFFDAVTSGLAHAARGTHPRKVLVVISDGGDNASASTFDDVVAGAQASNATIYTVVLADPIDPEANPDRMATLARISGGETFRPRSANDISRVLQTIARDIRHTYTLGYTPLKDPDGTFRRIRVIVTPPDGRRVVVRTRQGYLAARPRGDQTHGTP